MKFFHNTHKKLLEKKQSILSRSLMEEIDWEQPLIGVVGSRGIGKTSFLISAIKTVYPNKKDILYVDLNNYLFTERSIFSFADEFVKTGGKILVLDQIHKYPNWWDELKQCRNQFKGLKIIFTVSPIINTILEKNEHQGIADIHHLKGLSFREYLNYKTNCNFPHYTLEDLLKNHIKISKEITALVKPLAYFTDYLKEGYYPYFAAKDIFFTSKLLKQTNLTLEIDIPNTEQIEVKYLPKLRKLLYLIAKSSPFTPNVSKLSTDVATSRATIMNYLHYLEHAQLIQMLQSNGDESMMKKPEKILMDNTNLLYAIAPNNAGKEHLNQTFFYNQVKSVATIKSSTKADFKIDKEQHFTLGDQNIKPQQDCWAVADMIEVGSKDKIPLWLFGFLY